MYKRQMLLQKIVCMMMLIASVFVFAGSLGISTDLYDALSKTVLYPGTEYEFTYVPGSNVYYDMFGFNKTFTRVGIALILVNLILYITNTHSRRKYYIGNYIAIGLSTIATVAASVYCIPQIIKYKNQFINNVDFEALKTFSKEWGTLYIGPEDTFWFDICFAIFGFLMFASVLLILNCVFKVVVMKAEKRAIGSRKEDCLG